MLAKQKFGIRGRELAPHRRDFVPFTAQTRMSGVNFGRPRRSGKGAADRSQTLRRSNRRHRHRRSSTEHRRSGSRAPGGTPLVVADARAPLGVIHLKDIVKGGMRERFAALRAMGIKTVMITGDNPLTAAAIAKEAGVDDFLARGDARRQDGADQAGAGAPATWWR